MGRLMTNSEKLGLSLDVNDDNFINTREGSVKYIDSVKYYLPYSLPKINRGIEQLEPASRQRAAKIFGRLSDLGEFRGFRETVL